MINKIYNSNTLIESYYLQKTTDKSAINSFMISL